VERSRRKWISNPRERGAGRQIQRANPPNRGSIPLEELAKRPHLQQIRGGGKEPKAPEEQGEQRRRC
jgi:hypothetical protein